MFHSALGGGRRRGGEERGGGEGGEELTCSLVSQLEVLQILN